LILIRKAINQNALGDQVGAVLSLSDPYQFAAQTLLALLAVVMPRLGASTP
jgi:hypothetical protein